MGSSVSPTSSISRRHARLLVLKVDKHTASRANLELLQRIDMTLAQTEKYIEENRAEIEHPGKRQRPSRVL